MTLSGNFFMIASCTAKKGNSISFWNDLWDLGVLKWRFLELFSFARKCRLFVAQFNYWELSRNFRLPLSQQAATQLQMLTSELENINLSFADDDIWSYIWGSPNF